VTAMTDFAITEFGRDDVAANIEALGEMMHACVHAGASIGYILPYSPADGADFWARKVMPRLDGGNLLLLVARANERIAGAVQLDYDTPPNQPHRAEVRKLMVHPDFRRRGLARLLMLRVEEKARALGRHLLTLDTRTGDHAEPLYASIGYRTSGVIPGYCLDPRGRELDSTTIMYKPI